jgi:enoyl-CoA hydratase/carnithine racemase
MAEGNDAPLVLRHDEGGISTLTLNRPEKRNALSVDLFVALDAHLAALERETDNVGVVVLRANGPVFSAGADLGPQQKAPTRNFQAGTIDRLAHLPQPVIAAVHGPCYTGGLELALACDIIVAAEGARFADTHAQWALVPGWGMSQRLPRRVGAHKAREMMFTARAFDGRAAEAMGLVNLCVADDAFDTAVAEMASQIASLSWHSHRGNKRLLAETQDLPLAAGLAWEIANSPGVGPDFASRVGGRFG